MQIYIAAALVFQPTFFCVLLWTWYFFPPTDLLPCSWRILNGYREDRLDTKWCKREHVFRTIERKCIPGDTQDTCCCRAWGDTSMILLLPWGTDSHWATKHCPPKPWQLHMEEIVFCRETRFSQDQDIMIYSWCWLLIGYLWDVRAVCTSICWVISCHSQPCRQNRFHHMSRQDNIFHATPVYVCTSSNLWDRS